MLKRLATPRAPQVTLLEGDELNYRITAKGERQTGQPCQLTLAMNGSEPRSFLEEAGAGAPQSILIDVSTPGGAGRAVLEALSTRPWRYPDAPLIVYPQGGRRAESEEAASVGYLVRNEPVNDLIGVIRDTLGLAVPGL